MPDRRSGRPGRFRDRALCGDCPSFCADRASAGWPRRGRSPAEPFRVALKVASRVNSQVILDRPGAESLLGHGDMFVGGPFPVRRLQGPLVTGTELDRLGLR